MAGTARLLEDMDQLIAEVEAGARTILDSWAEWSPRADFVPSLENLASYLVLRHRDLRALQRELIRHGLSSLGRSESRVMESLRAVRAAVAALNGAAWSEVSDADAFFSGERRLERRATALFGRGAQDRQAALLVTCPDEAEAYREVIPALAQRGVEALRINCAHGDEGEWARMVDCVRAARADASHGMRVFMDLGGPKVRTGRVQARHGSKRVHVGDRVAMVHEGQLGQAMPADVALAFECTLPEALEAARGGQRMMIDDGKIALAVESAADGLVIARVTRAREDGVKIKPEKGVNLPDAELNVSALTDKDLQDLLFVAHHADAIGYSFVQEPDDVLRLQAALRALRPDDWTDIALVLKIETARAVHNLPALVACAGARQPVAVMIARGDLAVEIGFSRLAEMQEEIMWIAEAAQVPVIWATQVLETLVKEGQPRRGELTDAAMAARAEAVMLNKGPHVLNAIDTLESLLARMEQHLHKKTHQLRSLTSW